MHASQGRSRQKVHLQVSSVHPFGEAFGHQFSVCVFAAVVGENILNFPQFTIEALRKNLTV